LGGKQELLAVYVWIAVLTDLHVTWLIKRGSENSSMGIRKYKIIDGVKSERGEVSFYLKF
jgi:hypothetical protein